MARSRLNNASPARELARPACCHALGITVAATDAATFSAAFPAITGIDSKIIKKLIFAINFYF
jgi:hypothetical protein